MEFLVWLLLARMQDPKLPPAQRNDACYALRGASTAALNAEMRKALADPVVRSCAGANLRAARSADELKDALADPDYEVRALAARQLGALQRPDALPLLARAARDRQLLVAANAVEGLSFYRDPAVLPYLIDVAKDGGLAGAAALDRAAQFHDPRALAVARMLLARPDVSSRLAAIRVIGELGDAGDAPALREIAAKDTELVSSKGRGFGLMPAISLSRAANTALERIAARRQSQMR